MKKYIISVTIVISFLLAACNPDGVGIFYQISQEVEQTGSEVSEFAIYDVVEANSKIYALVGRSVWQQTGSSWSNISGSNKFYSIVAYNNVLYGVINNDDINLAEGIIESFDDTLETWSNSGYEYLSDIILFEADGNYVLVNDNDTFSHSTSGLASGDFTESSITSVDIIDGASNGTEDLLISIDTIYGSDFSGALSAQAIPSDITNMTGAFRGMASNGTTIYFSTSSGQIYSGTIAGGFTLQGTITDSSPVTGSLEVVLITIDSVQTEFLIIGTENGLYEMEIDVTALITKPSKITSISDFYATYPDLATESIFKIYQSAAGILNSTFYLATSEGLWKRGTDGKFNLE
jgi:predicted small secreted protein